MLARKDADFVMKEVYRNLMSVEIAAGEKRAQQEWPGWSQAQAANLVAACQTTAADHADALSRDRHGRRRG